MTEQGLKAVLYPELDEIGMQNLAKNLSETLSSTFVSIGVDTSQIENQIKEKVQSVTQDVTTTTTQVAQTSNTISNGSETQKPLTKDETAEAVAKGKKDAVESDPSLAEKETMPVSTKLGSVIGTLGTVASSVGAFGVGVADGVMKVFKFLEESSEPLKNVMGLFQQAFNLIWMPVGTILAVELMPLLRNVFQMVSGWVSRAMGLFKEGASLGEIIEGAFEMSFTLIEGLLTSDEFWNLLQKGVESALDFFTELLTTLFASEEFWKTLWTLIKDLFDVLPNAIFRAIFGEDFDFVNMLELIEASLNLIVGVFKFLMGDTEGAQETLGEALDTFGDYFSNIGKALVEAFKAMLDASPVWQTIKQVINGLSEWLETVGIDLDDFAEKQESGWNTMVDKFEKGDVVGGVGDAFWGTPGGQIVKGLGGLLGINSAEGGIFNEPTLRVVGEAGPEAIIPLNQLNQVANDYRTVGGTVNGGNVMNFYINGNNAVEIGEEVQRILEKTVGKASSKMMWW